MLIVHSPAYTAATMTLAMAAVARRYSIVTTAMLCSLAVWDDWPMLSQVCSTWASSPDRRPAFGGEARSRGCILSLVPILYGRCSAGKVCSSNSSTGSGREKSLTASTAGLPRVKSSARMGRRRPRRAVSLGEEDREASMVGMRPRRTLAEARLALTSSVALVSRQDMSWGQYASEPETPDRRWA